MVFFSNRLIEQNVVSTLYFLLRTVHRPCANLADVNYVLTLNLFLVNYVLTFHMLVDPVCVNYVLTPFWVARCERRSVKLRSLPSARK